MAPQETLIQQYLPPLEKGDTLEMITPDVVLYYQDAQPNTITNKYYFHIFPGEGDPQLVEVNIPFLPPEDLLNTGLLNKHLPAVEYKLNMGFLTNIERENLEQQKTELLQELTDWVMQQPL